MLDLRARRPANRPIVVGHRGASAYAPENTLASFELALQQGADMVECDVHLSRDGRPVVIHDHTLDRTTGGSGPVAALAADELRSLGVPTLDELLDWCQGRIPLSVELKNGPVFYEGLAERVVDLIQARGMLDQTNLISFDHQAIRRAKELAPTISAGVLFAARLVDAPAVAHAAWADVVLPQAGFATPDVVDQAHQAGLAISVWTVDEPALAVELADRGVDAIATNRPDRILAAFA
ncbi:MAG TPA: glycerophosphodiester phosphodiesterase family protein [Chloroflexota bacterium]|nr:glycerophosphodiester phosphodiesterase family protein [Chloroflexota bacterium]